MNVSRRLVSVAIVSVLGVAPLAAQQPASSSADSPVKSQTFAYENSLRTAVLLGGQKLAEQAQQVVPQLVLFASEEPIVRGIRLDGYGYFFDVQAPNIQRSSMMVWDMYQSRPAQPASSPAPAGGSASATVVAANTPAADPMSASPAAAFDPDRAYSNFVREALIDALLDSSGVLPIAPEEHLTIAASGIDQPGANPLYRVRKLMLTIKGSDLQDLRQGHISRDDAKARISEARF
jgi:hypothetical protein